MTEPTNDALDLAAYILTELVESNGRAIACFDDAELDEAFGAARAAGWIKASGLFGIEITAKGQAESIPAGRFTDTRGAGALTRGGC